MIIAKSNTSFKTTTKKTKIYSPTVLEARILKSPHWQGHVAFEASKRGSSLVSSQLLVASAVLEVQWLVAAPLQLLPLSSRGLRPLHVPVSKVHLLIRIPVTG